MSLQITVNSGNPAEAVEIIRFAEPDPPQRYMYKDVDGDEIIAVFPAAIPNVGPGVNIRTTHDGCSIPLGEIENFVQAVRDLATAARIEAQHQAVADIQDLACEMFGEGDHG